MRRAISFFFSVSILVFLLAACGGQEPAVQAPDSDPGSATAESPPVDEEPPPSPEAEGDAQASAWVSQFPALPAAPQAVTIPTEDGRTLAGMYYPAKVNPAPLVVLMHWAGGDMRDWQAIAPWLQNRSDEQSRVPGLASQTEQIDGPWLDPSWFPALLPEASFGVLVFDFNGYGESPAASSAEALLEDAVAALSFASTLEGVDPAQLLALGASIGADGAVDGCYAFNQLVADGGAQGRCLGALALAPGNYATRQFSFTEASEALGQDGNLVYCLSGIEDGLSWQLCSELTASEFYEDRLFAYGFDGEEHGMMLLNPDLFTSSPASQQSALDLSLQWLEQASGLPVALEP